MRFENHIKYYLSCQAAVRAAAVCLGHSWGTSVEQGPYKSPEQNLVTLDIQSQQGIYSTCNIDRTETSVAGCEKGAFCFFIEVWCQTLNHI